MDKRDRFYVACFVVLLLLLSVINWIDMQKLESRIDEMESKIERIFEHF